MTQLESPVAASHAAARSEDLRAALREFIPEVMRVTGTPGLTMAVSCGGEPPWDDAFGYRDLAARSAMTADTVTRGGSLAKLCVAISVLQLVERGAMTLHAPVAAYLDGLDVRNPLGERDVTAYDLLTHRSGLATDTIDGCLGMPPALEDFIRDALRRDESAEYNVARSRWTAKVGVRAQYSSFGLALLGLAVERANPDGMSFGQYVDHHILAPLDMDSTHVGRVDEPDEAGRALLERLSTGHARFGALALRTPAIESADTASVSVLTTARDQLRLMLALMRGGELDGARVLTRASVRAMLTPQVEMSEFTPASPWWVGLVVELQRLGEPDYFYGHGGAHPWGWWSDCRAYPELDCAVVVLTNKWEMLRWHNPSRENAHGFIADFIVDVLRRGERRPGPSRSWSWKASYAVGLILAERTHGLLGIRGTIADPDLDAIARNARPLSDPPDWRWVPDAFRRGYDDIVRAGTTPEAVRSFLASSEIGVEPTELRLLCHEFGGRGALPIPMGFFAGARGVRLPWAPDPATGSAAS